MLACHYASCHVVHVWFVRKCSATTSSPGYGEPDAPRSRQLLLATCVVLHWGGLRTPLFAGRHARPRRLRSVDLDYARSLGYRLKALERRACLAPICTRPEAASPRRTASCLPRCHPTLRLLERTLAHRFSPPRDPPRSNYRGCTVTAYDRCISH